MLQIEYHFYLPLLKDEMGANFVLMPKALDYLKYRGLDDYSNIIDDIQFYDLAMT